MTAVMLGTMVLCFALSISVAVSIGLAAILGIQASNAHMLISVKEMFNAINKFPLAAIPFFILAGNLMETGGISRRLVEFAKSLVGGVQGGLPMTCVLTCMIFAAVSGSSVATTFAIGAILIPALIKHGYPTSYAAALQALVKAKVEGGEVQFTPESKDESGEVVDLLAALKRSVDKAKASRGEAPAPQKTASRKSATKAPAKKAGSGAKAPAKKTASKSTAKTAAKKTAKKAS